MNYYQPKPQQQQQPIRSDTSALLEEKLPGKVTAKTGLATYSVIPSTTHLQRYNLVYSPKANRLATSVAKIRTRQGR